MDVKSRSYSNISLDSLEFKSKKKSQKEKAADEIVDTILVPFYEKDVLIKVPKGNKKNRKMCKKGTKVDAKRREDQPRGYLMNNLQRNKKESYLEMFRKQFSNINNYNEKFRTDPYEIRSISPEFGDTERESFGEDNNTNINCEFYNTEAYNELYYNKIMNQELEQYLEHSFEEGLRFDEEIRRKSPVDHDDNNLRSVSEVSQPRRHVRRTTVPLSQNVHLGGLGPDMENIRPRLERAKNLQRYSEKVRMENRLKIYKKEVEEANDKKAEKGASVKCRGTSVVRKSDQKDKKSSYLVDKTAQEKSSIIKKIRAKSKSSDVKRRQLEDDKPTKDPESLKGKESQPNRVMERKLQSAKDNLQKYIKAGYETSRKKSSVRSQSAEKNQNVAVSPVEIRFTVNIGGIRPSTALKSLEEKHRIYQEKVKGYMGPNNA